MGRLTRLMIRKQSKGYSVIAQYRGESGKQIRRKIGLAKGKEELKRFIEQLS